MVVSDGVANGSALCNWRVTGANLPQKSLHIKDILNSGLKADCLTVITTACY